MSPDATNLENAQFQPDLGHPERRSAQHLGTPKESPSSLEVFIVGACYLLRRRHSRHPRRLIVVDIVAFVFVVLVLRFPSRQMLDPRRFAKHSQQQVLRWSLHGF